MPELNGVRRMLDESIEKSRRLSHELSPSVLRHFGLVSALKWLASQMKEQFGLQVELAANADRENEDDPLKLFLFRAVRELLFNVAKHAGTKIVRVALTDRGDRLVLEVTDRGVGFDTDILERASVKSGLGLVSIRERARCLGGSLKIESAPGKGSRFTLTIPLKPADVPDSRRCDPEAPEKPADPVGCEDRAGEDAVRVLLADDHQIMRQGLIRLISSHPGIEVAGEAANGRQAVERALRLEPDVILMDVSMPEMDGIEATRRIKARLPRVRVIGLSMFEDEHVSRAMIKAGVDAFLSKTVSPDRLLKAIRGPSC
jgi:CheY-like chemotaxis protein